MDQVRTAAAGRGIEPAKTALWSRLRSLPVLRVVLATVLVLELAQLIFYNLVTYRMFFHSDAANKNMLAAEILRSGRFFPPDWISVDGLWVLANHLYVLVLYPFFNANSYPLHAAAGILNLLVMSLLTWAILGRLEFHIEARLLAMTVFCAGLSSIAGENFWGQAVYGFWATLTLLNVYLLLLAMERHTARRRAFALSCLLFGVVLFLTVLGGIRWVLTLCAPLLLANLCYAWFFPVDRNRGRALLWLAIIIVLAAGVGTGVVAGLNRTHLIVTPKQAAGFAPMDALPANANLAVTGLLALFGAVPLTSTAMLSLAGMRLVYGFVLLCLTLWGAVAWVRRVSNIQSPPLVYFTLFVVAGFLLNAYMLVFGSVLVDVFSARYMAVPVFLLMILALKYVDSLWHTWFRSRKGLSFLAVAVLPLYLFSPYYLVAPVIRSVDVQAGRLDVALNTSQQERLADFLVRHGQSYCYATYWNANSTTVLSGSQVRVRSIGFADRLPVPNLWLTSISWYSPETHDGPTCLVLSREEEKNVSLFRMETYLGKPDAALQLEDLDVFVYRFNIAARLPGWR